MYYTPATPMMTSGAELNQNTGNSTTQYPAPGTKIDLFLSVQLCLFLFHVPLTLRIVACSKHYEL